MPKQISDETARAIKAVEAIEQTVHNATWGWANQTAIKAIDDKVCVLSGWDRAYISEQLATISASTLTLYSHRKADRWGGSDQVKQTILAACHRIKDHVKIIEHQSTVSFQ